MEIGLFRVALGLLERGHRKALPKVYGVFQQWGAAFLSTAASGSEVVPAADKATAAYVSEIALAARLADFHVSVAMKLGDQSPRHPTPSVEPVAVLTNQVLELSESEQFN